MVWFCGFEMVTVLKPNRKVGNGLVFILAFENRTETETAHQIKCHLLYDCLLESIHLVLDSTTLVCHSFPPLSYSTIITYQCSLSKTKSYLAFL